MTDRTQQVKFTPSDLWELTDTLETLCGVPKNRSTEVAEVLLRVGYTRSNSTDSVKLERLDEEKLDEFIHELDNRAIANGYQCCDGTKLAKAICQRFGTVKMPTVERIKTMVENFQKVEWILANDPDDTDEAIESRVNNFSTAIHQLLPGGAEK